MSNKNSQQLPQTLTVQSTGGQKIDEDGYLKNRLISVISEHIDDNYPYVLEYIQNEINESTRVTGFEYKVKCFKEDGAYALSKAVQDVVGYTKQEDKKAPSGDKPPVMLNVTFSDKSCIKVPFGRINLPKYGNKAYIDMSYHADVQLMILYGECEKRYVKLLDSIIEKTNWYLATDSIYKNKAIKINSPEESPEFIDLSSVNAISLYLTPEAKFATEPIEARIEKTDLCIQNNIDIRFGVILSGKYGTGKTLYAFKLAQKAILNGWSFLYCPNAEHTLYIMKTANMLAANGRGCIVFLEDCERVLSVRDNSTNEISLMMDGGETKDKNVITILTTNHIELIDPTFLRGKRIGSIVKLTHPDVATAKKIIEGTMVDEDGMSILEDPCDEAAIMIENNEIVPAFVMEILDRVKSHLIYREKKTVSCQDIISSIKSFKDQMDMAGLKDLTKSDAELFYDQFKKLVSNNSEKPHQEVMDKLDVIEKYLN